MTPKRLPPWLKRPIGSKGVLHPMKVRLREKGLHTVCEGALCPNIGECWGKGTATFMILGDLCTRGCSFCNVRKGIPAPVDPEEPTRLAEMVLALRLRHVVITCVARDDLPDLGASQFIRCIEKIKGTEVRVEILSTDFSLNFSIIDDVLEVKPDIFNHNVETVERLTPLVRDRKATYENSIRFLRYLKKRGQRQVTKSGFMLGLGETRAEVLKTLEDLAGAGCDIVTIGQYLRPGSKNLPVARFVPPEEFSEYGEVARRMGFSSVASGPFVRSSYNAEDMVNIAGL